MLSADQENDPAVLGIIGASAALVLSPIPFLVPIAAVKMGRKDGEFIINPTNSDSDESDLDIVVAGSRDAIMMVEGGAGFIGDDALIEAIDLAHKSMMPLIEMQEQLAQKVGKKKWPVNLVEVPAELKERIREALAPDLAQVLPSREKLDRAQRLREAYDTHLPNYADLDEDLVRKAFEEITKETMRSALFATGKRIDGRRPTTSGRSPARRRSSRGPTAPRCSRGARPRPLPLPPSAPPTTSRKSNPSTREKATGPSCSTITSRPSAWARSSVSRSPSRREIGHGHLAERALSAILPSKEDFPYTIRIVSEILESNGSSSMASVCAGCLSLMDAGVPVKEPVAGIAMGLLMEEGRDVILSDILGDEDQMGDMDFKVAGSRRGITAIQMDIKVKGITKEIMSRAVKLAQNGIGRILDIMAQTLEKPRDILSPYAPRIWTLKIRPEKIREVIGPGGKVIKSIVEQTGVKIDIEDSGIVKIVSHDEEFGEQGDRDHQGHYQGDRGRRHLPGDRQEGRRFRRHRRDTSRRRRSRPCEPAFRHVHQEGIGRGQGRRPDNGQGDRGGAERKDKALQEGSAQGRSRENPNKCTGRQCSITGSAW